MANKPQFSIILLTYLKPNLINARVSELAVLYRRRQDVEVLICDNGSTLMELRSSLAAHKLNYGRGEGWQFNTMRIDENVGFGPGFNKAVAASQGEVIILISDDVRIYGDFLDIVGRFYQAAPTAIIAKRVIDFNSGWNKFGGQPHITYPEGFFLAMSRKIWRLLGGFDERFFPYDYEDIDLGMTANQKGIPLIEADIPVEHQIAGTIGYSPERFQHTVNMRRLFAQKWALPNDPQVP